MNFEYNLTLQSAYQYYYKYDGLDNGGELGRHKLNWPNWMLSQHLIARLAPQGG